MAAEASISQRDMLYQNGPEAFPRPKFNFFGPRLLQGNVEKTKVLKLASMFESMITMQKQETPRKSIKNQSDILSKIPKSCKSGKVFVSKQHFLPLTTVIPLNYSHLQRIEDDKSDSNTITNKASALNTIKALVYKQPNSSKNGFKQLDSISNVTSSQITSSDGMFAQNSALPCTTPKRPNVVYKQPSKLTDAIKPRVTNVSKCCFPSEFVAVPRQTASSNGVFKQPAVVAESSSKGVEANTRQAPPAFVTVRNRLECFNAAPKKFKLSKGISILPTSVTTPTAAKAKRNDPVCVRSFVRVSKPQIFVSNAFSAKCTKDFAIPVTSRRVQASPEEGAKAFDESVISNVTKYTIRNFDKNSKTLIDLKRRQSNQEPRLEMARKEVNDGDGILGLRNETSSNHSRWEADLCFEHPLSVLIDEYAEAIGDFEKNKKGTATEEQSRSMVVVENVSPGESRIEYVRSNEPPAGKARWPNGINARLSQRGKLNRSDRISRLPRSLERDLPLVGKPVRLHSRSDSESFSDNDEICLQTAQDSDRHSCDDDTCFSGEVDLRWHYVGKEEQEIHDSYERERPRRCRGSSSEESSYEDDACFRQPRAPKCRRLGVYGVILADRGSSETCEESDSSDLSSATSEGSANRKFTEMPCLTEKVKYDEFLDYDSGVCEDIEDNKPHWHSSYSSKLMEIVQKKVSHKLWCQIPEVYNSDFFKKLTSTQRKLQEAKFEVITSEISYAKSLDVLISHFLESESMNNENVISKKDRRVLFSNIIPVKNCSERFLIDLMNCWQEDASLQCIGEIIHQHAEKNFRVYITYCRNQVHQANMINHLMKSEEFFKVIEDLECHPVCQNMSLHCFLIMPMQRVTRMRLLVDGILARLPSDNPKRDSWKLVLATLNKLVQECNDGARYEGQIEEMKLLHEQIDFGDVGKFNLLTSGRFLVKKGQLLHLYCTDDPCHLGISSLNNAPIVPSWLLPFGRKLTKQSLHLFLFTDLLVITKKKSNETFIVLDYCQRDFLDILTGDPSILQELPQKHFSEYRKNIFHLFILKNCENRKIEMILSASDESKKIQWLEAFTSYPSDNSITHKYEKSLPHLVASPSSESQQEICV